MKLVAVDGQHNLFRVEDAYPQELLEQFLSADHLSTPGNKEEWQENYARRRLVVDKGSVYDLLDAYVKSELQNIASVIGVELMACDTGFWLDEAGFSMTPHVDNPGVQVSMQVYLNANDENLGTIFYNPDMTVRYAAKYQVNTGYLMINSPEQQHGMDVKVPRDSYRISSYSWLYPKA